MITKKIQQTVRRALAVPGTARKPLLVVLYELLCWVIAHRGAVNVYFDYELYLRGRKTGDYLRSYEFKSVERRLNSREYYPLLEDKYFFYKILEGQGFRAPRNLYLVDRFNIFHMESRKYITEDEFLQKNFDGFCKLFNGFGGKMIYRAEVMDHHLYLNKEKISYPDFLSFVGKEKYLIQERIEQHEAMNALNPSCVNTMRMLTLRTGPLFHLYQVYLRIGINNSYVDNGLSGNIMIGIDKERGKLMEYAYSSGIGEAQYKLDRHPQTDVTFKDWPIPFFEESVEMAKSLHLTFQQFFMIGWDIGITPDGPVVLEGNNISDLYPFQVLYGGLKRSFFKLAEEYQNWL